MTVMKRKRETQESAKAAKVAKPILKTAVKAAKAIKPALAKDSAALRPAKKAKSAVVHTTAAPFAASTTDGEPVLGDGSVTIQIIVGSYDRTLHGVTATVAPGAKQAVDFADTFLFNAHTSAIRCLALSPVSAYVPGQAQKYMLATGSTDERINIYNLSAHPPAASASAAGEEERRLMATVVQHRPVMAIAESSKNRELGTLLHHTSTVTRLSFPTRSKLLSASEDSTVAVTRTRDWSLLSNIRVPVAKAGTGGSVRRPSGDTAAPGAMPAGVNDFAVHPSMKVMLTVSRGERCMRLWNLVTGKKAGVLSFGRDLLRDLGEGKHAPGEGRQVAWGRTMAGDAAGGAADAAEDSDEFAIGFDRNVVVFSMDSRPRCKVLADARTKTHDFHYVEFTGPPGPFVLLAVATEDGRILLCSTRPDDLVPPPAAAAPEDDKSVRNAAPPLPCARIVGQMGGQAVGVSGRVKAFKVLPVVETVKEGKKSRLQTVWYVVSATSTGVLRVWRLTDTELRQAAAASRAGTAEAPTATAQVGALLGTYQTPDRITCLEAFVMTPLPEGVEVSEDEASSDEDDDEGDEDDD